MSYINIPPSTAGSEAYVNNAIANVVDSAPAALDTLRELALALGGDDNFAATVTNSLATKAPLASPTFTGTVAGITKSMVGLGNVDNTSDANKPVSTATATALALKANLASPTFTGDMNIATETSSSGTKTINIATGGLSGSAANVTIGALAANSRIDLNANVYLNSTTLVKAIENAQAGTFAVSFFNGQTSGAINIVSGASFTGNLNLANNANFNGTVSIAAGATASGSTKTVNIGTAGLSGSISNVNIGSTTGASNTTFGGNVIFAKTATPASATATGTTGTIVWDANYVYVCTATNTWKRTAISTW